MNRLRGSVARWWTAFVILLSPTAVGAAQWGGVDTTFTLGSGKSAGFDKDTVCVALQPDGKIVVGGIFTQFRGTARNGIARINADGTIDGGFNPGSGASDTVQALALQPDGSVVIGGRFLTVNGVSHIALARLGTNGVVDASFNPAFISGAENIVTSLALQADGRIVIGGIFSPSGTGVPTCVTRLNADGTVDPAFSPPLISDSVRSSPSVQSLALQADGRIVIGGQFTDVGSLGRNGIARVNADGSPDATFDPGPGTGLGTPDRGLYRDVNSVAVQPDGRILAGGDFTNIVGATSYYFARLNNGGSLDLASPLALAFGGLNSVITEVDGKTIIGGEIEGQIVPPFNPNDMARLMASGSLDTNFDVGAGPTGGTVGEIPMVRAVAIQADGKLVVVGNFASFNGSSRNYIVRLLGDQGGTVAFAAATYSVDENGGNATIALHRTGGTTGSVSVNYATRNGTATAGADYVAQTGAVLFGPGETDKTFTVPIMADGLVEGNETVNLTLANPLGGALLGAQRTAVLTIVDNTNTVANGAPTLAPISDKNVAEQTALTFTAAATDPNGDTLTYSLDPGAPSGAAINPATGAFSWTPTEAQGPGSYPITVRVTDNGSPPLSDSKTFTISVSETNQPPVLTVPADQTIPEGTTLVLTNTAADPDLPANSLLFSLVSGPTGVNLDANTGILTWTPTEAQGPGSYPITVRVTDNGSPAMSDSKTFTISVSETNRPPVLTVPADQSIPEGTTLVLTNTATDPDLPANSLLFSLVSAPTGVNLDANTGILTWTPTEAQGPGSYSITVRVTDNGSPPMSNDWSFNVTVSESNSPPVLAPIPDKVALPGNLLQFTVTASDPDLPANTLTFSLDPGAPAGAAIGSASGVFSWTPPAGQPAGTNSVTVRVTDNGVPTLSATRSFNIVVPPPPVIQSIAADSGTVTITWSSAAGLNYRLESKTDLAAATWDPVAGDVPASGPTASKSDTISGGQRFYRVALLP